MTMENKTMTEETEIQELKDRIKQLEQERNNKTQIINRIEQAPQRKQEIPKLTIIDFLIYPIIGFVIILLLILLEII